MRNSAAVDPTTIAVTRRYTFPAAHVLRHPSFSDSENQRVYGKCANPSGHGHNYGIEVSVTGPVDERMGWVVDPAVLDATFDAQVRGRFAHRLLNDLAEFSSQVPTAENLAQAIYASLAEPLADCSSACLVEVRVVETRRNSFTYRPSPTETRSEPTTQMSQTTP
ncbi:MAG: 6-carboxytetrahydropterin synthase [Myxococcota bacterium]